MVIYLSLYALRYGEAEAMEAWCSGLTCVPVKDEIAGSNPVGTAPSNSLAQAMAQSSISAARSRSFPPRIGMISTVDHTIRRRWSADAVAHAALANSWRRVTTPGRR